MNPLCRFTLCIAILLMPGLTPPAASAGDETRSDKLDIILRQQDLRMLYQGKLQTFITDPDPVVREHAIRAFGSIQDTSFIPQLVERLMNDTLPVQRSAAFAIGQTASLMSPFGRATLQHDLIWSRLDRLPDEMNGPADRLIEAVGKFGTREGLKDLLQRFGTGSLRPHREGMNWAIVRFAFRGITAPEATRYVLDQALSGGEVPWQVAYALQRIGNQPEIRNSIAILARLYQHPDPLVRMNCAVLLGKVRDTAVCIEPLQKLADGDPDWRVRVNALKGLADFNLRNNELCLRTLKMAIGSPITSVAVTALSAIGECGLRKNEGSGIARELIGEVEKIAVNSGRVYPWQLQAEAVTAIAHIEGKEAAGILNPSDEYAPAVNEAILSALGTAGGKDALAILSRSASGGDPVLVRASLDGLRELSRNNSADTLIVNNAYRIMVASLSSADVAVRTTSASILGDSVLLRKESVGPLKEALESLRLPEDIEYLQEISNTLAQLHAVGAVDILREKLSVRDRAARTAIASALRKITGAEVEITETLEPMYVDFDFAYLHALPDTVTLRMETIRGTVMIELYKDVAPFTVMNIVKLTDQKGFYKGLTFHRVVPNFVVQGGDPRGDGWGGPGFSIRSEFSDLRYERGTIGMASSGKDTEGSQFFITHSPQPHLEGRYTIVGKVISGMDAVDKLELGDRIGNLAVER